MDKIFNTEFVDTLNKSFLDEEKYQQYSEFINDNGEKSDRYLYRQIEKIQAQVSNEHKKFHLNNLDNLLKMQGFIDEYTKNRIEYVKKLIIIDESENNNKDLDEVNTEFFGGASLLFWFLLVTVLFRRGGRNRRGFYRY